MTRDAGGETGHGETTPRRLLASAAGAAGGIGVASLASPDDAAAAVLDGYHNVQNYGATGTGETDDTAAINLALETLGPTGGTIYFPPGVYRFSSLNFDDTRSVRLLGAGGLSAGAQPATSLVSGSGGSSPLISARSTKGFQISDMQILYGNATFNGRFVDLGHGSSGRDSAHAVFDRCFFGGAGIHTASALFALSRAIIVSFTNCVFAGAQRAIEGRTSATDYSNAIRFAGCTFKDQEHKHVLSAGEAWTFDGCTFENLVTSGGGQSSAGAYGYNAAMTAKGLSFLGCWFGDATASGDWINFSGVGLSVRGCYFGSGAVGVRLGAAGRPENAVIQGNHFDRQTAAGISVDAAGGGGRGLTLVPNSYNGGARRINWGGSPTSSDIVSHARAVAARRPGAVVRKLEVFDEAGNSLGFIPLYNGIS